MKQILSTKAFVSSILIFSVICGFVVYYVYNKEKNTVGTETKPSVVIMPEVTLNGTSTVGWKTFVEPISGVSIKYPNTFESETLRNGACFKDDSFDFCLLSFFITDSNTSLGEIVDNEKISKQFYSSYNATRTPTTIQGHEAFLSDDSDATSQSILFRNGDYVVEVSGWRIPEGIFSTINFTQPVVNFLPYTLDIGWNDKEVELQEDPDLVAERSCSDGVSYIVGVVNNGEFAGDRLIARQHVECGMDCGGRSESELNYYVYHQGFQVPIPVGPDTKFQLNNFETPKEIQIPNSAYVLKRDFASGFFNLSSVKSTLMSDSIAGPVYQDNYRGCIQVERKDHARVYYSLNLPFMNKENGQIDSTLSDGSKFNESYNADSDWSCLNIVDDPSKNHNLHEIGRNNLGEPLFGLDGNDDKLKSLYENKNTIAAYGNASTTYQDYLKLNPILYWRDPFGRWVEFLNKKYLMAAEKCKPVIYLYPQRKMDVSVYVKPNGGFTHTIPEYNDGWHVTAFPDGKIIDKQSGVTYPYSYWAGWSIDVPKITKGWMVSKQNIEPFLIDKLTKLGLNQEEISDFNEYWVGRLNEDGAPFYKIMFLDQDEFNQLAPMRVVGEETPDHIIRVIMYAQASVGNENLPTQILPETPKRDGFTVVEWGGSLIK